MSRLILWDDPADEVRFYPFSLSRPLGEVRHGAWLLRERWERVAGTRAAAYLCAPHLTHFTEPGAPGVVAGATGPCVVGRSTFAPEHDAELPDEAAPARLVDEHGALVGAVVPAGAAFSAAGAAAWPARPVRGRLLAGAWQLVAELGETLRSDLTRVHVDRPGVIPRGCTVLGDPSLVVATEANVEPHVVFDVRSGPVVLDAGVEVRTFSRLQGPLYAGPGTRIVGGQLREVSIGPRCIVHGEVAASIFLGYANKAHEGFLGHSVLGRWANLGAGTITSNLKNTYGTVRLSLAGERVDTGLTFLGALIGDHVKTAIGTLLPTGCVVGTGANLFGARRPDGAVPPFAWGTDEAGRLLTCRRFVQIAERVLPRRDVVVDETTRAWLTDVWTHATGRPCD